MHRFMICTFWARPRRLVVVTGQLLPRLSAARPLLQTANQIAASLTADQSEPGDTGGLSLCNNLEQSRQRELSEHRETPEEIEERMKVEIEA